VAAVVGDGGNALADKDDDGKNGIRLFLLFVRRGRVDGAHRAWHGTRHGGRKRWMSGDLGQRCMVARASGGGGFRAAAATPPPRPPVPSMVVDLFQQRVCI
jgi:hypothetical protein